MDSRTRGGGEAEDGGGTRLKTYITRWAISTAFYLYIWFIKTNSQCYHRSPITHRAAAQSSTKQKPGHGRNSTTPSPLGRFSAICYNAVIPTPYPHWPARLHRCRQMLTGPPAASLLPPAGPAVCCRPGLGFRRNPAWMTARPAGRRPSRLGCLFTSASRGPTLKCFPAAARWARLGSTRFPVRRTRWVVFSLPRRPSSPVGQGSLSLFSYTVFLIHVWKQWRVVESPPMSKCFFAIGNFQSFISLFYWLLRPHHSFMHKLPEGRNISVSLTTPEQGQSTGPCMFQWRNGSKKKEATEAR